MVVYYGYFGDNKFQKMPLFLYINKGNKVLNICLSSCEFELLFAFLSRILHET